jgi:hypothetical protein
MPLSTILCAAMETQQCVIFSTNVEIRISCNVQLLGYCNSLIPFHSKRALLWRRSLAANNKTHLGLHAKCPTLLSDFNQVWIFSTNFHRSLQYRISPKSVQWEQSWYTHDTHVERRTNRHDLANRCFSRLTRKHRTTITASCKIIRQITRTQ